MLHFPITRHTRLTQRFLHVLQEPGRELDQLCSFLGLSPSAEEKEKVLTGSSFDNMKQNKMTNYSTLPLMDQKVSPFMRKGTVKQSPIFSCVAFTKCVSLVIPLLLTWWAALIACRFLHKYGLAQVVAIFSSAAKCAFVTDIVKLAAWWFLHSRKSWRLEEPFHRGPEWRVWRTLRSENEGYYT